MDPHLCQGPLEAIGIRLMGFEGKTFDCVRESGITPDGEKRRQVPGPGVAGHH